MQSKRLSGIAHGTMPALKTCPCLFVLTSPALTSLYQSCELRLAVQYWGMESSWGILKSVGARAVSYSGGWHRLCRHARYRFIHTKRRRSSSYIRAFIVQKLAAWTASADH